MGVNELRIGNYVTLEEKVTKILGIKNEKVELLNYAKWVELIKIKPILLTEEILLKYGFKKYDKGESYDLNELYDNNSCISLSIRHDNLFFITIYNDNYNESSSLKLTHIKHLHQLQNLYFSLTNQELEIKL